MAQDTEANVTQDLSKLFNYKGMKSIMAGLLTHNCETQALAVDGNVYDVQTTGGKGAMLNGQSITVTADAAMDISADTTEVTKTQWVTATSYTKEDIRWTADGNLRRMRCIVTHTSEADNEPIVGSRWEDKWEVAPHGAVNATGWSIADAYEAWILGTVQKDGTINLWKASDVTITTTGAELKIPQTDHKKYVPVGTILYANSAGDSAADVIGNTSTCDFSTYGTFIQVTGPVFPHEDNTDKN